MVAIVLVIAALVLLLLALTVGKGKAKPQSTLKPVEKGRVERIDYGGVPMGAGMFVRHWYQRKDGSYYSLTEWSNRNG